VRTLKANARAKEREEPIVEAGYNTLKQDIEKILLGADKSRL
jgi:hypothetical protein